MNHLITQSNALCIRVESIVHDSSIPREAIVPPLGQNERFK